jgi:hypothetical protein
MVRRSALVLLLTGLPAPSAASEPSSEFHLTYRTSFGRTYYLAVVDGPLTVTGSLPRAVKGKTSAVWYVEGTRIKSETGRGYLAYDPTGKDDAVFLAPRPGRNTEWWSPALGETPKDRGPRGEKGWTSLFYAANRKVKDRWLCLEFRRGGKGREDTRPAYRPVVRDDHSKRFEAFRRLKE